MKKTTVFCDACKQEITKLGKEFEIIAADIEERRKDTYYLPMTAWLEICAPCTKIIKEEGGTLYFDVMGKKPPQII